MYGFGNRLSMGGVAFDGYRPYEGIDATSEKGINIIFDHAEVC